MLSYHLTQSLDESEKKDWAELVQNELGASVHPNRAQGFSLARSALKSCLREKNISVEIKNILLRNYHELEAYPFLTISLTHTSTLGAAVVGDTSIYRSVGIDVEPLTRVVKLMILERVAHPNDLKTEPIKLWALKEAAFKALMNTQAFSVPQEFSSLEIRANGTWIHGPSKIHGEWSLEDHPLFVIALAFIKI